MSNNSPVKYAILAVCDQTITYWSSDGFTTKHQEVLLFDDRTQAEALLLDVVGDDVVEVTDESEFRARPDTW